MKILAILLFVVGLFALGRFNYLNSRRMARHLMSLVRGE
jgi:hypothetical protein